ncbi:SWIM zinc finger family protein [Aureibaculum algae]|uniref:SWIM zinc finger family protein n=1 Tax=Aureibaculum algae TaxID=2584122 RepID=A0A5B7TS83_9FLAO|nr:SWIM zinc finger family protein [Aureibaculum algae]QCX38043.1 SWIM zinc finger family protein [Aureibaculum algae]
MDITYQYNEPSTITKGKNGSEIFLSHYNESFEEKEVPCFFWGKLKEPYTIARSLLTLSKIVASNFMPLGSALRDPVITAGGEKLRLEGFSSCCSVYGKVTILPEALDGEFLQQGTTNVDFNTEMIAALSKINKGEHVFFSIGKKEFVMQKQDHKVIEKKVSLPIRWIKGMATVQLLSAAMKEVAVLDKLQIQLLFRAIPKGDVKDDYYLNFRGKKPALSPINTKGSICIGGIHRLRLLENLRPLAQKLIIYITESEQATAFQFELSNVRFTAILSRSFWRGFSGEGNTLENLIEDIPEEWMQKLNTYAHINEEFSPDDPILKDLPSIEFKSVATRLSAMGLLGFDLNEGNYYYRKLPFKMSSVESLNPRYKNALKLIKKGDYEWVKNSDEETETKIKGSGLFHKVIITPHKTLCTCTWFATHQTSRGACKHILATQILKNNTEKELKQLLEEFEL